MNRYAWVVFVVGCRGGDGPPAVTTATRTPPAAGDLPCTPSLHDRTELRLPGPGFEGYRFVGGSPDGRRVAMVVTHIGPGSGAPVGGLRVAEAGAARPVLDRSYFTGGGTVADLAGVEQGLLAENAAEIAAAGVELGKHLPAPQPWCADASGQIFLPSGRELKLDVTRSPCDKDPRHRTLGWEVCARDAETSCVRTGPRGCIDGALTVLNIYRLENIDWVVVDLLMQPFPEIDLHVRQVAGGAISGS